MRAELINLPFTNELHRRIDPPLYLLQLAPVLEAMGFSIRVNDLNGIPSGSWGFGKCLLYVLYVDMNGFGLASEIALGLTRINREAIIIACGSGPSKNPKKHVKSGLFSLVVCGESEVVVPVFIYDRIRNRNEKANILRSEVENINKLPLPSRNLVEMNTYSRRLCDKRAAMILGSRGSPYRATWLCSGLKVFGINRISNEIDQITKVYGIKNFFFGDESFTFDKMRAKNIGALFAEKALSFGFNDVISSVDYELYKELNELGAKEVMLNPAGNTDSKLIGKVRSKIEFETGIRVMVKQDAKYHGRGERYGRENGQPGGTGR